MEDIEVKVKSKTDSSKNCQLGAIAHHVTMFMIGCAIGAVLTMLYTSFLPIGKLNRLVPQTRSYGRVRGHDFSIFSHLQSPSADSNNSKRMKRSVTQNNSTNTTAKPTIASSSTVRPTIKQNDTINNVTNYCPFTDVTIKSHCQIPFQLQSLGLDNISFYDVLGSVYSRSIDNQWNCEAGLWCPQSEDQWQLVTEMAERWGSGNYQAQICPLLDCLSKLPKTSYCEDEKRDLVINTVTMLCSMPMTRETKLRDITCVKHVLMMEHHDMSDLSRLNRTTSKDLCNTTSCNSDCASLYTEFADLYVACDSYRYYIGNFKPWQWYYKSDLKKDCNVHSSMDRKFSFDFIGQYRSEIIVLVTLTTAVLVIAIAFCSVRFWKRRKVVYKRTPETESDMAEMEGLLVT